MDMALREAVYTGQVDLAAELVTTADQSTRNKVLPDTMSMGDMFIAAAIAEKQSQLALHVRSVNEQADGRIRDVLPKILVRV